MKYEIKIEFKDTNFLSKLIETSYKDGVLIDKTQKITLTEDSPFFNLCKGLSNHTARIWNEELIDGSLRCLIQEEGDVTSLYPCSIKYEMENNKYSFII